MMFVRTVHLTGATDIDAGVRYFSETAPPVLREQPGFRGVIASADRACRVLGFLSLWETEAARDASEIAMMSTREEGRRMTGGAITVENYEELLAERAEPPAPGSALFLLRMCIDPAAVDESLAFFARDVLPRMRSAPGFRTVRFMINRQMGDGRVGSIWADTASMDEWEKTSGTLWQRAAQRRVTLRDRSKREIVFTYLG
jgi:heme-degrading monooxygenase HmoA